MNEGSPKLLGRFAEQTDPCPCVHTWGETDRERDRRTETEREEEGSPLALGDTNFLRLNFLYVFGQAYDDTCLPLQCHTEQYHRLKSPVLPPRSPPT